MKPNDIINAMHGCIFGAILWLIFTITSDAGRWLFVGYSTDVAMFLYFIVAVIFMIIFTIIGVFIGSFFNSK